MAAAKRVVQESPEGGVSSGSQAEDKRNRGTDCRKPWFSETEFNLSIFWVVASQTVSDSVYWEAWPYVLGHLNPDMDTVVERCCWGENKILCFKRLVL